MRKADFAELVLSLVSSRERAAAVVGDLLEENEAHGAWRFWFFVVRTALSRLRQQITDDPLRMAGVAMRGVFAELGFLVTACLILLLTLWIAISVLTVYFHAKLPDGAGLWLGYVLSNVLVPFQVGRWMARKYPGREGAGTVALGTLHAATNLCAGLIMWEVVRHGGTADITVAFTGIRFISWDGNIFGMLGCAVFYLTLYQFFVLAGAATVRAQPARSALP